MNWAEWLIIIVIGLIVLSCLGMFASQVWEALWSGPKVNKRLSDWVEVIEKQGKEIQELREEERNSSEELSKVAKYVNYLENKERADKLLAEANKWIEDCRQKYEYSKDVKIRSPHFGTTWTSDTVLIWNSGGTLSEVRKPKKPKTPEITYRSLPVTGEWDLDTFEMDIIPKLIAEYHKSRCDKKSK